MPRLLSAYLVVLLTLLTGCAGKQLEPPRYKAVDELGRCEPGECVEAKLAFRHWADAPYYKGRMIYHCDPGSELDGPPDPGVTRLIFVVHGNVGDSPAALLRLETPPGLYQLRGVAKALRRAQTLDRTIDPERVAIIAPTFQPNEEWQPYTDEDPRVWTWKHSSYNWGTNAIERKNKVGVVRAEPVSSFDVIDEFLRAAVVKFPSLDSIVLVGHSAGGQTIHRYAYAGVGVTEHLEAEGVHVTYMPANGGAYAFPLPVRRMPRGRRSVPKGDGHGDTLDWVFAQPSGCKNHDRWGFGLSRLHKYERLVRAAEYAMDVYLRPVNRKLARKGRNDEVGGANWSRAARAALTLQYANRDIWHFQAATDLDGTYQESCASLLQGRSRFERFSNFQQMWIEKLGIEAPNMHFVALEDAKHPHSSRVVYASDAGVHVLFGGM